MTDWIPLLIVGLLQAAVRMSAPLSIGAMGELLSERSGVLNIGIEGTMLLGAFAAFTTVYGTGNLLLGMLVAVIVGVIAHLVFALLTVTLRADQVTCGMGLYLLGLGLTFFYFRLIFGTPVVPPTIDTFPIVKIPILSDIPILGEILFQHYALVYVALLLVPIFWIILFRTNLGLKIRAVGENPLAADTAGINVFRIRYLCLIISGMMCGMAGAFFTTSYYNMFLHNITAGRGFIAIAIVILGSWNPYKALAGALLFGGAEALGLRLQAIGFALPYQFSLMLPYILTVVVLLLVSRKANVPATLCIPYKRGER